LCAVLQNSIDIIRYGVGNIRICRIRNHLYWLVLSL
jgi:hypothetical protein